MRPTTSLCFVTPLVFGILEIKANTIRYRQGRLVDDDMILVRNYTSVAAARRRCQIDEDCVAFGFESPFTRFPAGDTIAALFYAHADWHVSRVTGAPAFFEDPTWHLYVNTTRERDQVRGEVEYVLERVKERVPPSAKSGLRARSALTEPDEAAVTLLVDSLYSIVSPREIKAVAAATPELIETMLRIGCTDGVVSPELRLAALTVVLVIADAEETVPLLLAAGVYEKLTAFVDANAENNVDAWGPLPTRALDILSNLALHRTRNVRERGAQRFFQRIVTGNEGFPALQAALALTHTLDVAGTLYGDGEHSDDDDIVMADPLVERLVTLTKNAIDGDVAYGIVWELVPGPLSALRFLVRHHDRVRNSNETPGSGRRRGAQRHVLDTLLDAGLLEQLLRVLEADVVVAAHMEAALDVLDGLATASRRARGTMVLMAGSIHAAQRRLAAYEEPAALARRLAQSVSGLGFVGDDDRMRSEL